VSCRSRAGCCCGTKRASKFQKEDSTKVFVGISSKPISKKMLRNSSRIFIRGWRAPTLGGIPIALKLYGLKVAFFQLPLSCQHEMSCIALGIGYLCSISTLMSVSCFLMSSVNSGPFSTEK